MPMWLIWNALRRAKMDPTRQRPSGGVVDDGRSDPIAPGIHHLQADARRRLSGAVGLELPPTHRTESLLAALDRDGRGWTRGDPDVGRATQMVLHLAPARHRPIQELISGR